MHVIKCSCSIIEASTNGINTLLKTITQKFTSFFTKPEVNAAQDWQAANGEAEHAFWLFAAPVTMLPGQDSFYMGDPAPAAISGEESEALMASLNQLFADDGYHFYLQSNRWFLGLDNDPQVTVTHLNEVVNKDVAQYLPTGVGASAWNKAQTEIQMLLFTHPVNQAREAQDLPMINSLWCYGLGASRLGASE